jgi:hypothetical protein
LTVALIALACVRDTNAYLLLAVAVIAGIAALRREHRRRALVIAIACALGATVNIALANRAQRWYWPVSETIAVRVVKAPGGAHALAAAGMPHTASLQALGTDYERLIAFTRDAKYAADRRWVLHHGRPTYLKFLVAHPRWMITKPFDDRDALLAPRLLAYGRIYHDEPRGGFRIIGAVAFPGSPVLVEVWLLVAAGCVWVYRRDRRFVLSIAVLAALAVPSYYLAWHGDALELDRHSLSAAVELRLALWITTLVTSDRLLRREREPSET